MAVSTNRDTEKSDETQPSLKGHAESEPQESVTDENIRTFIHVEDAPTWDKYLRVNYEIDQLDELTKEEASFTDKLIGLVKAEKGSVDWPKEYEQFLIFKRDFQFVDLFMSPKDIKDLFDDPRFVNYCWIRLLSHSRDEDGGIFNRFYNSEKELSLRVSKKDFTNKLRLDSVTQAIQTARMSVRKKKIMILDWHSHWLKYKYSDVSWLDINDEQNNEWIFEILSDNQIGSVHIDGGSTPTECYWSILMLLDSEGDTDLIRGLIPKLRKSLSQRKYRAKNQDLKYYSIAMTAETKQKLDAIVADQDTKIHRVIERLINREYDKK